MKKKRVNGNGRGKFVALCILGFFASALVSIICKNVFSSFTLRKYSVKWSDNVGKKYADISYGTGDANKFDLYVPSDKTKKSYGTDKSDEVAAYLFGTMRGEEIDPVILGTEKYDELMKPISALLNVDENTVPTVMAYGKYDKVQPYEASIRLDQALTEAGVDHEYIVFEHSGHGLQNDDKEMIQYNEAVLDYLNRYMPIE